jgi:hypothetical protein
MSIQLNIRITPEEKSKISKLARSFSLSISEYLRLKIFSHNSDYIGKDPKFIVPHDSKHVYFMAMSQVKLMFAFERLFVEHGFMSQEEFRKFDMKIAQASRDLIAKHGYQKISEDQTKTKQNEEQDDN